MLPLMPGILPVSFVTWLDRDAALPYHSYGHSSGYGGRPVGGRIGPFPSSEAEGMGTTVGQVTSPKGCSILTGSLKCLRKKGWTVSIYTGESMVTPTRSGKGLHEEKQKRKRKNISARTQSPTQKLQGEHVPFLYSCFARLSLWAMTIEKWNFLVPGTNAWPNFEESQTSISWGVVYLKPCVHVLSLAQITKSILT